MIFAKCFTKNYVRVALNHNFKLTFIRHKIDSNRYFKPLTIRSDERTLISQFSYGIIQFTHAMSLKLIKKIKLCEKEVCRSNSYEVEKQKSKINFLKTNRGFLAGSFKHGDFLIIIH